LCDSIEHIKRVVTMQQSYAHSTAVVEKVAPTEIVEDALRIQAAALSRHNVDLVKEIEPVPPVVVDKHKLLQILINLISNAKYACDEKNSAAGRITVRVRTAPREKVVIEVEDNGVGIREENMDKIFRQGFTTRKNGHGFGLHSSALAAKQLGGSLEAHSEGPGAGARFTLEFPMHNAEMN